MTLFRTSLAAAVIAASIAAAPAAFAVSSTQTVTVGTGGAPTVTTDLNAVPFSSAITLFNPATALAGQAAGTTVTLNDVQVAYAVRATTGGTVKNTAAQAQTFTFSLGLSTYLSAGTGTPAVIANDFGFGASKALAVNFATGSYGNLASGATAPYPTTGNSPNVNSPVSLEILTDATNLAAFTGTGSFTLGLNTLSGQTVTGGGGNVVSTLSTFAGGTFVVTYDYTLNAPPVVPVPEPTTIALLGAGLIGLGLVRRRKNG